MVLGQHLPIISNPVPLATLTLLSEPYNPSAAAALEGEHTETLHATEDGWILKNVELRARIQDCH